MPCIVLKYNYFFKWSVIGRRPTMPYPGYATNLRTFEVIELKFIPFEGVSYREKKEEMKYAAEYLETDFRSVIGIRRSNLCRERER